MPKSVSPISLSDAEVSKLHLIVSEQSLSSPDVKRRAAIVLELAQGKQIKDVAKSFGIRENTVTEIRRRFLKSRLGSLETAPKSGRPTNCCKVGEIEGRFDGFVAAFSQEHGRSPTVKEVSAGLNGSVNAVRQLMIQRGFVEGRKKIWDIVLSSMKPRVVDLVGLYVSNEHQIFGVRIFTRTEGNQPDTRTSVKTVNRSFAESYSPDPQVSNFAQLADVLDAFTLAGSMSKPQKGACIRFIENLIGSYGSREGGSFYLLVSGSPLVAKGGRMIHGAVVDRCGDVKLWLQKVTYLLDLLGTEASEVSLAEKIASGLERYLTSANSDTEPFVWVKLPNGAGVPEKDHATGKAVIFPEYGKEAGALPAPGTIRVQAQIMGDDGHWISFAVSRSTGFTQDGFSMASADSYLQGLSRIEEIIASATHDAARGLNERYLTETGRRKGTQPGSGVLPPGSSLN